MTAGTYTITAGDSKGDSASKTLTVNPEPPTFSFSSNPVLMGQEVTILGQNGIPGNNLYIEFGDNTAVYVPAYADGSFTVSHTYTTDGSKVVTATQMSTGLMAIKYPDRQPGTDTDDQPQS